MFLRTFIQSNILWEIIHTTILGLKVKIMKDITLSSMGITYLGIINTRIQLPKSDSLNIHLTRQFLDFKSGELMTDAVQRVLKI